MRNRGQQRTSPSGYPRVGEGAYGTLFAIGHLLLQMSLDGQASGGQGGFSPLHPLTRVPLDRSDMPRARASLFAVLLFYKQP
ncbi:hypothetical protein VT03_25025 [Planctomyces sp. SH-PL14]|nr:hypothetical protein VT03_25025 [Planctomyces sp. SH-PL14]